MPPRSAVSLLAHPAPVPVPIPSPSPIPIQIYRQWLCSFLHSPPPPTSWTPLTYQIRASSPRTALAPQFRRRIDFNFPRPFHHTAARRDDAIDNARNHYETLKVSPTASASEIKKSFYNLSKTHHPDLHEASARRAAARRFMRISEAYSILSSPPKRAKYDREQMALHHHTPTPAAAAKKGSYSSTTGMAGGRPASGLSRRRGAFQGPPPSFFRSGGWGAQGEKRRAAHEGSTGGAGSPSGTATSSGAGTGTGTGTVGGMGPGQDPFGHRDDVPHFDKESHQRTGRHSDRRREARRAAAAAEDDPDRPHRSRRSVAIEPEAGVAGMFFAIGGVLLLSFMGPLLIGRAWSGGAREPTMERRKKKEEG